MEKFTYSKIYKAVLLISIPLILLILYSCFLDRSLITIPRRPASDWEAKSTPGIICPNEEITISWDVGSLDCADTATISGDDCVQFVCSNISDGSEFFRRDQGSGSRIIRDINTSTAFRYSVIARDLDVRPVAWETIRDEVVVIPADSESPFLPTHTVYWGPQAQCVRDMSSPLPTFRYDLTYYWLNTGSPEFIESTKGWGECVRVVEICHDRTAVETAYPIIITTTDGSLPPTPIAVNGCVSGLRLQTELFYLVQVERPDALTGNCSGHPQTGGSPTVPPVLVLTVRLGCDPTIDACR